jgi:hypothetical protein
MSHTNQTGVTEKMQNLKISFGQIYFFKKKLKRKKSSKKPLHPNIATRSEASNRAMVKPHGGGGRLDLEGHYAFYDAYHNNTVNVGIHELFVWPIFLTGLMLLHLTAPSSHAADISAMIHGAYYFLLDHRVGTLGAFLCFLCWSVSGALATRLGFSVGWKVRRKDAPFASIVEWIVS